MPKRSRRGRVSISVGFYYVNGATAGNASDAANHAHLIDKGTKDRYTRNGKYRGKVEPNYFWTHAKQRSRPRAEQILIAGLTQSFSTL